MSYWKRTLPIFKAKPVRVELDGDRVIIGEIESVGETSCAVIKADGALVVVDYAELIGVEPAVSKL